VPSSPSIQESLWAPETDDTYESSILWALPSVQPVAFPRVQISPSIHPSCTPLLPCMPPKNKADLVQLSKAFQAGLHQLLFVVLATFSDANGICISLGLCVYHTLVPISSFYCSLTTVVTPVLSPERSPITLTRTPSTVSVVSSILMRPDMPLLPTPPVPTMSPPTLPSPTPTPLSLLTLPLPPPSTPVAHASSSRTSAASRFTIYHQAGEDLHQSLLYCLTYPKTQKSKQIVAEHKKPASQA